MHHTHFEAVVLITSCCVWLTSVLTTMYDYMLLVQYRYIYKSLDLYCYSQF